MKTVTRTSTVHFSANRQVAIPRRLRTELAIKKGTRALVYQAGDAIVLKPITPRYIMNLRGSLKGSGVLNSLMDSCKRERDLN